MNSLYKIINISKQGFYKYINNKFKKHSEKQQILLLIHQIRQDHPTMCCRDMYYKPLPTTMGRDKFERFCKENNLMSIRKHNYKRITDSSGVKRFDNLISNLNITSINQVWTSDITYYELSGKFYFLTFIIDSFSRRIVGHSVSERLSTEHTTLPSLKMAIKTRKETLLNGLIFHSDGGGQYYDK